MTNYPEAFSALTELPAARVVLRPLQVDWAEPMFEAVHESRVELRQYMPWETDKPEAIRTFLEGAVREREAGSGLSLCIYEVETDDISGVISLKDLDPFTPLCEVGYWIRSTKAGRGYATEALSTLIDYARDLLKLVRLDARVVTTNIASQRVLGKCGFEEEGFKPKGQLCHGDWQDVKLYGKLLD